jgi:hypothetical protein
MNGFCLIFSNFAAILTLQALDALGMQNPMKMLDKRERFSKEPVQKSLFFVIRCEKVGNFSPVILKKLIKHKSYSFKKSYRCEK